MNLSSFQDSIGIRPKRHENSMMFKHTFRTSSALLVLLSLLCLALTSSQTVNAQSSSTPKFVAPKFSNAKNAPEPEPALVELEEADVEEAADELTIEDSDADAALEELLLQAEEDGDDDADALISISVASEEDEDEADDNAASDETATASVDVTKNPSGNQVEREPYDVYKENGKYFVGWEKPDVALVFTGMTNGYIEPCGCAGMDRMKGGLSRRQTFLNQLRKEMGWDVVAVDSGQITVGFGVQEELKFDMAMNAFQLMQYDAIGIGKGELRFPAYFLLTFTTPTSNTSQSLFTSANIGVYGYHPTYTLPYKVIERGGKKFCVVSVVCKDETLNQRDENLFFEDPAKKLAEITPEIKKEECDSYILIVHGSEEETTALAKKFPLFNYVLTSDTPSEPPAELRAINGNQHMIEVGEKGKYAIVLGLYKDGDVRYQRVALDSRYESSAEITLLMKDYQNIMKSLISTKGFRGGLGVNPAKSPRADELGKYVGAQKCRSCHEDAWKTWAKSRHATAWKSLKETANPPRTFDPECIGCHVEGWDGLQHFPYVDGYDSEETTPELLNVGCESCHGPGERHIAAELDSNVKTQERIRSMMRLGDNVKKVCYTCHDGDNSPEFDFDAYYPLISHEESEDEDE